MCKDIPERKGHKVFFDNWFTTLPLLLYLKSKGILAVGTIRANCLQHCPLMTNKDLEKSGRGSLDYRVDNNSGIIVTKWVDNKVVQLVSNYTGIEPMGSVSCWNKS